MSKLYEQMAIGDKIIKTSPYRASTGDIGERDADTPFLRKNFIAADGTTNYAKEGEYAKLYETLLEKSPEVLLPGSDANHFKIASEPSIFITLPVATSGTLTAEQLKLVKDQEKDVILIMNGTLYRCSSRGTNLEWSVIRRDNLLSTDKYYQKNIIIVATTGAWTTHDITLVDAITQDVKSKITWTAKSGWTVTVNYAKLYGNVLSVGMKAVGTATAGSEATVLEALKYNGTLITNYTGSQHFPLSCSNQYNASYGANAYINTSGNIWCENNHSGAASYNLAFTIIL